MEKFKKILWYFSMFLSLIPLIIGVSLTCVLLFFPFSVKNKSFIRGTKDCIQFFKAIINVLV